MKNTTATAIYEHGVLRLLTPLPLAEHSQLELSVHQVTVPTENALHHMQLRALLIAEGLVLPTADTPSDGSLLLAEQRAALAHTLAGQQSLAEMIIQDREER